MRVDRGGPVGILALQGDFAAHGRAVEEAGHRPRPVRRAGELEGLAALILPGGESTTMLKLLRGDGLREGIEDFARAGGPILATCAGVVLLARTVVNPEQESLDLLDLDVYRMGYGRQVHSTIHTLPGPPGLGPIEAVFIRAPRITRVGRQVEVLAALEEDPVLVRQGAIVATTFHPELARENRVHSWFLEGVAGVE